MTELQMTERQIAPDHLQPVTPRENVMRSTSFIVALANKQACPAGHPYDEQNTRWYQARRYCRACDNARSKARAHTEEGRRYMREYMRSYLPARRAAKRGAAR